MSIAAITTVARLTLWRAWRGRTATIIAAIGGLPILVAIATKQFDKTLSLASIFTMVLLTLAVTAQMTSASTIGQELETRTMAYLWSRPLPRWTILVGKLAGLIPLVVGVAIASAIGASLISTQSVPPARMLAAIAAMAAVFLASGAAIASLTPRFAVAVAISYGLFVDRALAEVPISARAVSATFHAATLAGLPPGSGQQTVTGGVIGLAVAFALWLGLAIWRIGKLE